MFALMALIIHMFIFVDVAGIYHVGRHLIDARNLCQAGHPSWHCWGYHLLSFMFASVRPTICLTVFTKSGVDTRVIHLRLLAGCQPV